MKETYKQIPGAMCDFHAYYEAIALWLPENARIIEVGVADGHSAIFLAETLENMGKSYELVMVDSLDYGKSDQLTTLIGNVIRSGCVGLRILPLESLTASCKFPDNWAHFVFIDASHEYELTKADIRLWYKKVIDGGVLAGHDYNSNGVMQAVDEIIPKDMSQIIRTEKDLGVWSCLKVSGRQLL